MPIGSFGEDLENIIMQLVLNDEFGYMVPINCFVWDENSNMSFQKIKSLLEKSSLKLLWYYNRNKLVTLQCDASLKGLVACIIQDGQPIAFGSKSFIDRETCYVNIERNSKPSCMAVRSSTPTCTEGHSLLKLTMRPIEMISLKNLIAAPARL